KADPDSLVTVAGIMSSYQERKTKAGKNMALGSIEDLTGRVNIIVFAKTLEKIGDILRSTEPVIIKGRILVDGENDENREIKISVNEVTLIKDVRSTKTKEIHIVVDGSTFELTSMDDFKALLNMNTGRCDSFLVVNTKEAQTLVRLPEQYRLAPTDALINDMSQFKGIEDILFKN
ncbi:MAG: hypothetical protein JXR91_16500, partial [Deltaproteobacteria bacterium]|nr:hypothetical protein [Deltaproteobacteria bacterium]